MNWKALKAHFTVEAVLAAGGKLQGLRVSGNRLVGPCPLHGGDNPSAFSVDRTRDLWYCFTRCATGGDSLSLAWHLCGRSWPSTADWLTSLLASTPALRSSRPAPASVTTRPIRAFSAFTRALRLDVEHPFFRARGLAPHILRRFEAGVWHGAGFLEGMAAVRLHDLDGRPLGYAGRRRDPEQASRNGKWKWPPGFPKTSLLYNWHRARGSLACGLVVVEGPWSVMRLAQEGYDNAVALAGLTCSRPQAALLAAADRVFLLLDGDPAGKQATQRLLEARIHRRLCVLHSPAGADPADLDAVTLRGLLAPVGIRHVSIAVPPKSAPASNTTANPRPSNRQADSSAIPSQDSEPHRLLLRRAPPAAEPVAQTHSEHKNGLPSGPTSPRS